MPGGAAPGALHEEAEREAQRRAGNVVPPASRIGLALAGGGPLGGSTRLARCSRSPSRSPASTSMILDVYVGVSSGGFVAAALANGISPTQMYRLFIDEGRRCRPVAGAVPAARLFRICATRIVGSPACSRRRLPSSFATPSAAALLAPSPPSVARAHGSVRQRAIDAFLHGCSPTGGRSNDFRHLRHKLFLVATNLDTGAAVTFGEPGYDHVPIYAAIAASAALPGLFPPVEIDGEHYVDGALNKTLHASVALDQGVEPSPLRQSSGAVRCKPPRGDAVSPSRRLNQGGLPLVLAQTFRAIIHSRMKTGMEKYRRQYPHADVLLFEPDREDADMFFANIFSYAHRARLCEAAYRKTRARLMEQRAEARAAARATWDPARPGEARRSASADSRRAHRSAAALHRSAERQGRRTRSRAHPRCARRLAASSPRATRPGLASGAGGTATVFRRLGPTKHRAAAIREVDLPRL